MALFCLTYNSLIYIIFSQFYIIMDNEKINHHLFIFGSTGKGHSSFTGQPQQASLFEENSEFYSNQEKIKDSKKTQRLQNIREAYWLSTLEIDSELFEFSTIHDSLVEFLNIDSPTIEEQKIVFDLLPQHIIGGGISWGFNDTEVRDNIYVFIRENAELIQEKIRLNIR